MREKCFRKGYGKAVHIPCRELVLNFTGEFFIAGEVTEAYARQRVKLRERTDYDKIRGKGLFAKRIKQAFFSAVFDKRFVKNKKAVFVLGDDLHEFIVFYEKSGRIGRIGKKNKAVCRKSGNGIIYFPVDFMLFFLDSIV